MKHNSRVNQILKIVEYNTNQYLALNDLYNIGIEAQKISESIFVERSNVSRILNTLNQEQKLIKTKTRPTLYIAYQPIKEYCNNKQIPTIVANIEELISIIKNKSLYDLNNHKFLDSIIGIKNNESLHNQIQMIKSSIYYPNGGLNILIYGDRDTGKGSLAKKIAYQYAQFEKIKKESIKSINCYSHTIDSLINNITKGKDAKEIEVFILLNIDDIFNKNFDIFRATIISFFKSKQNKQPYIIGTYNDELDTRKYASSQTFFQTIIKTTNFQEKTIKEKFEYTLKFFQEEADNINSDIIISKDVITYFSLSFYEYNLLNLRNEIKLSVSQSYYRMITTQPYLNTIIIDYCDLTEHLLNNCENHELYANELNSVYSMIHDDHIHFYSKKENGLFLKLHNTPLKSDRTLDVTLSNTDLISVEDYCKSELYRLKNKLIKYINPIDNYGIIEILNESNFFHQYQVETIIFDYLVLHLNTVINSVINHSYIDKYAINDINSLSKEIMNFASYIYDSLTKKLCINIPIVEKYFIAIYLNEILINLNSKPHVFIICHGEYISDYYSNYVKTLTNNVCIHSYNYSTFFQNEKYSLFLKKLTTDIKEIENINEIVFLVDLPPLTSIGSKIEANTKIKCLTLHPISLPLLIDTIHNIDKNQYTIKNLTHNLTSTTLSDNVKPEYTFLLNTIQEKFLRESLSFLDPVKSSSILYEKLLIISKELNIELTEQLIIKFIIHACLAIERSIKKEEYIIENDINYITKHHPIFIIIKNNFQSINEIFGCDISDDEIKIISSIFMN